MRVASDGHSAGPAGEQQNGVIGGGVTVDGDAIERTLDGVMEQIGSNSGFEGGVGEEIHQHGGMQGGWRSSLELRVDHARALADAGDTHGDPAHRKTRHRNLGARIGGHDGSRHLLQVSRGGAQGSVQCRQGRG